MSAIIKAEMPEIEENRTLELGLGEYIAACEDGGVAPSYETSPVQGSYGRVDADYGYACGAVSDGTYVYVARQNWWSSDREILKLDPSNGWSKVASNTVTGGVPGSNDARLMIKDGLLYCFISTPEGTNRTFAISLDNFTAEPTETTLAFSGQTEGVLKGATWNEYLDSYAAFDENGLYVFSADGTKKTQTAFGDGMRFEAEHHVLSADAPETVWESRNAELLAFPLNHRVEAYGFILKEKEPMPNVRKDAIEKYGLTIAEIATLKRGEDVVRPAGIDAEPGPENGFMRFSGGPEPLVINCREVTYRPYIPRSYAYCSDTAPFPRLHEWVRGVTLLYHEATFPEELSDMAAKTYHSTARQAAECARDAGAGRLLIGHYSSRYPDVSVFLKEAREIFPDTVLANEGDVIEVPLIKFSV